jgi:hypothetical protein
MKKSRPVVDDHITLQSGFIFQNRGCLRLRYADLFVEEFQIRMEMDKQVSKLIDKKRANCPSVLQYETSIPNVAP